MWDYGGSCTPAYLCLLRVLPGELCSVYACLCVLEFAYVCISVPDVVPVGKYACAHIALLSTFGTPLVFSKCHAYLSFFF